MMLNKLIFKAKKEAVSFVKESYLATNNAKGFPELYKRNRITEWGGTNCGIHIIKQYGDNNQNNLDIIELAAHWLLSQQKETGAWDSTGVDLLEATSDVVYYLKINNLISPIQLSKAVSFIKDCYRNGYFVSNKRSNRSSIYATYLATKTLSLLNEDFDKSKIIEWVINALNGNELWSDEPQNSNSSIAHTIYALNILNCCGCSWIEIRGIHKKKINWIYNEIIRKKYFSYEEFPIETSEDDLSGKKYHRIRIRHFNIPLYINFLINIEEYTRASILARRLLKMQYRGGWGISESELTLWSTQQSLDSLNNLEKNVLKRNLLFFSIFSFFDYRYLLIRFLLSIFFVIIAIFFLMSTDYNANFIVEFYSVLLTLFLTWVIKK